MHYSAAVKQIETVQARTGPAVNPVCRWQLLTHGQKVDRAIVFWHGLTNCPHQFRQLGQMFYDRGYNVLIPRLPHHGLVDRMTPIQAQLTAEELVVLAGQVVDIARGLGHQVTVVGFSAGGVLTGWLAQHCPDIDRAVIIAPAFGLKIVPARLTGFLTDLLLIWPNFFIWWDPRLKADLPGPAYAYPRFSSRALGQILRLGLVVRANARRTKPAASSILVVTNANDLAVNNRLTAEIVGHWHRHTPERLHTYQFAVQLRLIHDLIDPAQVGQRVDIVYPVLVDLITQMGSHDQLIPGSFGGLKSRL